MNAKYVFYFFSKEPKIRALLIFDLYVMIESIEKMFFSTPPFHHIETSFERIQICVTQFRKKNVALFNLISVIKFWFDRIENRWKLEFKLNIILHRRGALEIFEKFPEISNIITFDEFFIVDNVDLKKNWLWSLKFPLPSKCNISPKNGSEW